MSLRHRALLPWAVLVLCVALAAAYAVLGLSRTRPVGGIPPTAITDVVGLLPFLALPAVGAVIATRQPRNPLGWLLLLAGVSNTLSNFAGEYSLHALLLHRGTWPGGKVGLWLWYWTWEPGGFTAPLALLLLPNGHFLSPRWRWVGRATLAVLALGLVAAAFGSGFATAVPELRNPLRIWTLGAAGLAIFSGIGAAMALLTALGFASLVLRFRRAGTVERLQLKWVLYAAGGLPVQFVVSLIAFPAFVAEHPFFAVVNATVNFVTVLAMAVALGVAILKYRLYDIDVVINRTLVYATLAGFITAVYVAIVVGVGTLVGSGGRPNLVLSIVATAVVAVAFQPARERVQRVANRLVYGERATPYEVLSEFSARVAESYAGDQVLPRMAQVLAEGTGAERAAVWLRSGNSLRPAAAWPGAGTPEDEVVELAGQVVLTVPGADRAVAVRHRGELLGALSVSKRAGESLTPIEGKLLDDLAHQAGLVLRNVGLTADLRARLVDLRASRQRLVAAQDEERRRLERNLHDGAQQHLVALKVKLGLAETLATRDPDRAVRLLGQLQSDADEALRTVRDLARGIYPPLLAAEGLAAALESQARKATVPVTVEAGGVGRHPQEIEAAVYFCCLEGLQNVQKYARATRVTVTVGEGEGYLRFEVRDDGLGFDPDTTRRGAGLQNMADRLDALGGGMEVRSTPGGGTVLAGRVPAPALAGSAS